MVGPRRAQGEANRAPAFPPLCVQCFDAGLEKSAYSALKNAVESRGIKFWGEGVDVVGVWKER